MVMIAGIKVYRMLVDELRMEWLNLRSSGRQV